MENKFASIFDLNPHPMAIIDTAGGHVIEANQAYTSLTGEAREELINTLVRDFHLWPHREPPVDRAGTGLPEEEIKGMEITIRQKNGDLRKLHFSTRLIEIEKNRCLLLFGNDLAESQRAEEALRKNEEKYRTLLEDLGIGYFEGDLDGTLTFVNDVISSNLGYPREDLIGLKTRQLQDEAGCARSLQAFTKLCRTGEPFKLLELEFLQKDGIKGTYEISVDLIRDSRGTPIGFRGVSRDVTERKKLTERLNRAEKMEALGTMAGGVAHDLNNILGVFVGYAEMLSKALPGNSLEREYAETIVQSGWKCSAIVDDLLTLARRGVQISEVIDLNRLVFDYLMSPEFEQLNTYHPDVRIQTEIEEELLKIKGSSLHLTKSVMNLISNAMEAISGPGFVTIRTGNCYLESPLQGYDDMQEGEYVVLTVSDTGAGISAGDLGKIFEPFYTKKVMGRSGTGLGLAVVWGTVKDHHGYIDVQSEEGRGTTFNLYFPVTEEAMKKAEKPLSPEFYMGWGESVLVVDDLREQRELAQRMLGQLGYAVEACASGEEALQYLNNKSVDLIVLDMIMPPGMDGLETYLQIRESHPGQKVMLVSGYSEDDRVKKARELGAGAFVRKPYVMEKIGLAAREVLA